MATKEDLVDPQSYQEVFEIEETDGLSGKEVIWFDCIQLMKNLLLFCQAMREVLEAGLS